MINNNLKFCEKLWIWISLYLVKWIEWLILLPVLRCKVQGWMSCSKKHSNLSHSGWICWCFPEPDFIGTASQKGRWRWWDWQKANLLHLSIGHVYVCLVHRWQCVDLSQLSTGLCSSFITRLLQPYFVYVCILDNNCNIHNHGGRVLLFLLCCSLCRRFGWWFRRVTMITWTPVQVVESSARVLLYPYHVGVPYPIMRNFKPKN